MINRQENQSQPERMMMIRKWLGRKNMSMKRQENQNQPVEMMMTRKKIPEMSTMKIMNVRTATDDSTEASERVV